MEQSRVELDADPGDTIVDAITLHNRSDKSVDVKVYWQDFEYAAPFNGEKDFLPSGSSPYTMAGWVSYSPVQVTIPAYGRRDIQYTIRVPSDAKGGYQGVLFFEQGRPRQSKATGISIVTRLGALFFIKSNVRTHVYLPGGTSSLISNSKSPFFFAGR